MSSQVVVEVKLSFFLISKNLSSKNFQRVTDHHSDQINELKLKSL